MCSVKHFETKKIAKRKSTKIFTMKRANIFRMFHSNPNASDSDSKLRL